MVALERTAARMEIPLRSRVELLEGPDRFVFHRAAEAPDIAVAMIEDARRRATEGALVALRSQLGGTRAACAVVPMGNQKLPAELGLILASHSRIHAAEGAFYRDIVAAACEALGIAVQRVPERDVADLAARRLALTAQGLTATMKALGGRLGPPWGEDQRIAVMAALSYSNGSAIR